MSNECGAECTIGADRDEDRTVDVWCISEERLPSAELRKRIGIELCMTL